MCRLSRNLGASTSWNPPDSQHMKVVRLSALRTGRLYLEEIFLRFCYRLSRPQGHMAAEKITPIKNSNDTIRNRTRDLPACSAVPQPTEPPRAPFCTGNRDITLSIMVQTVPTNSNPSSRETVKIEFLDFSTFFCLELNRDETVQTQH
jgi:hypothetical protein